MCKLIQEFPLRVLLLLNSRANPWKLFIVLISKEIFSDSRVNPNDRSLVQIVTPVTKSDTSHTAPLCMALHIVRAVRLEYDQAGFDNREQTHSLSRRRSAHTPTRLGCQSGS